MVERERGIDKQLATFQTMTSAFRVLAKRRLGSGQEHKFRPICRAILQCMGGSILSK
jgi:hypothetical protein